MGGAREAVHLMTMRAFITIVENELPMDTASRMERARDLGFTIPAFHGTGAKFNEFDLEKGQPSMMGGYAPHFSDKKAEAKGYADERKAEGKKAHLLHVLLRVRNPLVIDMWQQHGVITPGEFKRITGQDWVPDGPNSARNVTEPTGYAALRELQRQADWNDRRGVWTTIYKRLIACGYDALNYLNVPGDHHGGYYGKYVVFDPKNIRSTKARFDPTKAESRNIMD